MQLQTVLCYSCTDEMEFIKSFLKSKINYIYPQGPLAQSEILGPHLHLMSTLRQGGELKSSKNSSDMLYYVTEWLVSDFSTWRVKVAFKGPRLKWRFFVGRFDHWRRYQYGVSKLWAPMTLWRGAKNFKKIHNESFTMPSNTADFFFETATYFGPYMTITGESIQYDKLRYNAIHICSPYVFTLWVAASLQCLL